MASTIDDDITQPISESYLQLSQDVDEISDSSVRVNTFDNSQLMHLVKQIDDRQTETDSDNDDTGSNGNDNGANDAPGINNDDNNDNDKMHKHDDELLNDDTELMVQDELLKPMISSQSTPIIQRNKNYSISINELNTLLKPLLNKEFKGLKELIIQVMNSESGLLNPIRESNRSSDLDNNDNDNESDTTDTDTNKVVDDDSPTTTPPNSQEEIKDSFASYSNTTPRLPRQTESSSSSSSGEIASLRSQLKQLQLENQRLRAESANSQSTNERINQLETVNRQLTFKLNDSKTYNKELINEIDYLNKQSQRAHDNKATASSSSFHQQTQTSSDIHSKTNELLQKIDRLNVQIGDSNNLCTADNIDPKFVNDYKRLKLHKIDNLTKVEMSNLIKNILLTMLLSYDELPDNLINFVQFFKQLNQFAITAHNILYPNDSNQIPGYYKHLNQQNLDNLSTCLRDMCDVIKHYIE